MTHLNIIAILMFTMALVYTSHQTPKNRNTRAILLYHVTSSESVNIIDKTNRISFLNGRNNANDLETEFENKNSLPKLYNLLYSNEKYMLIGTRERVLNITLSNLETNRDIDKLYWESRNKYQYKCHLPKTLNAEKILYTCHNYITAAIELNDSLIICGTNASIPYCRLYQKNTHDLVGEFKLPQISALNRITNNNFLNSEQIPPFVADDSIYFVNSGSYTIEPTINKQIVQSNDRFSTLIKTPKGALKNAKFRASFDYNDKVYFFFYETESVMDIKNGLTFKTPFSLIGEVCKNDNGKGSYLENFNRFITFKKAVIYCYLPDYQDGFHVKYTEIQAVSKPITLNNNEDVFYAIFTFRRLNSVDSALCQYKTSTVRDTMTGYFKSTDHNDRILYKKPMSTCDQFKQMSDSDLNRYYNDRAHNYNFQMEQTVNEPALFALNNIKFTAIAVDAPNPRNNYNEVIFVGMEDGRVIKLLTRPVDLKKNNQKLQQPVIVQEYKLFESSVNSLVVSEGKLIAISNEKVRSVDLDLGCNRYSDSCSECLNSQDPYCAWSVENLKCTSSFSVESNLIKINRYGSAKKCLNLTNSGYFLNDEDINEEQVYTINTQTSELKNSFDYEFPAYSRIRTKENTGNLLVAIFLTALLTCLCSVGLTCLLINKRYKMADYLSRHLSTTLSSNRSTASNESYNYKSDNKFLPNHMNQSPGKSNRKNHRYTNFYESSLKPLLDHPIFAKKNINLQTTRYDTPTVNTNVSSSTDCTQQHSPNSELTSQPKSINDTLSSSNESCCFDPQSLSDEICHTHVNCDRYTKRPYSSPINSKSQIDRIESIKLNKSLISSKIDVSHDSNV